MLMNRSALRTAPAASGAAARSPAPRAENSIAFRPSRAARRGGTPPPIPAGIYIAPDVDSIKTNKWAFGHCTIYSGGFRQGLSEISVAVTKGFIDAIVLRGYIECDQVTAEPPVRILHLVTLNYIQHDD